MASEIISFDIWNLLTKWFGDDWILTGVKQGLLDLGPVRPGMCCRSDRLVLCGQTGAAHGLTGRRCVGFGFELFIWISVIVLYLWLLDGYYAYVILLFATNESSWRELGLGI